MKSSITRIICATGLLALTPAASAVVLLTDNFTVLPGGVNNQDVNQLIGNGRLGGTLAAGFITSGSAYTMSANDHHQVGNTGTNVGQPNVSDGNYVLVAFDGSFQSKVDIAASATGIVTIEYDLYIHNANPGGGAADMWGAVTLRSTSGVDGWPVVPSGEFGFLTRADGRIQGFQGSYPGAWDSTPGFAMNDHWKLVFTDITGTGSAFNGNGSQVIITNGTTTLGTVPLVQLNSSNLQLTFRNLGNRFIGIDNLSISTVPEPTGALLLSLSLGMMALRRKRSA
jgi:hypothetical protein